MARFQALKNRFVHSFRSSHHRCSIKKVFLIISQNSQENTCARVCFLIQLQASGKGHWQRCFPVNFAVLQHLFYRTPPDDCFCTFNYGRVKPVLYVHVLTLTLTLSNFISWFAVCVSTWTFNWSWWVVPICMTCSYGLDYDIILSKNIPYRSWVRFSINNIRLQYALALIISGFNMQS